tara:strand:- start:28 stop:432 length:405 start_codon:yes stop_codon:yes gene_type:complete
MSNIIDKIYDNTKDGVPNYSINLIDGRRLYYRGMVLNPLPQSGDAIEYTIINTKTSANGNQYTNIKDVKVATAHSEPINQTPTNNFNKNNTQRLDIFVTGIVGRSMGSGHFSVDDIEKLTKNAVSAFNENLEKL